MWQGARLREVNWEVSPEHLNNQWLTVCTGQTYYSSLYRQGWEKKGNLDPVALQKLSPRDKGSGTQGESYKINKDKDDTESAVHGAGGMCRRQFDM